MLNARLYRTAWLVAAVAVVVALLTLQPRAVAPEPDVPPAIDGQHVRELADTLQGIAPSRPPGASQTEDRAARWVQHQLEALPGATGGPSPRVQRQEFAARVDGSLASMVNVYLAQPGAADGVSRAGIVVIAPRDTPPGVEGGAAGTALLVELARLSSTTTHRRPLMFVSVSGSTVGQAGVRWFLRRFSEFPVAAVIVLDGIGDGPGPLWIWSGGTDARQALDLDAYARAAAVRAGAAPAPFLGMWTQLLRFAVPQSFGGQAPFVSAGVPAVTLSGRPDGPPRAAPVPDAERLTQAGNVALNLIGGLDAIDRVPAPSASIVLAEKDLRPGVLRIVLLLVALPLVVAAVDALARLRRARVSTRPGLVAVLWRAAPLVAGVALLHVLAAAGMLPPTAAGMPPLPADVPFTPSGGMALAICLVVGVTVWVVARHRAHRAGAAPASEAAAGLVALAAVVLGTWLVSPFLLVLALPAAHAVLVATTVRRPWQLVALAVVGALPLVALCVVFGDQLGRDPFWAAWYLTATTASASRGLGEPFLAIALAACIWSMAALVVLRARKGLLGGPPASRPRARRPGGQDPRGTSLNPFRPRGAA